MTMMQREGGEDLSCVTTSCYCPATCSEPPQNVNRLLPTATLTSAGANRVSSLVSAGSLSVVADLLRRRDVVAEVISTSPACPSRSLLSIVSLLACS